ncbi:MAG: hypothetical protein ACHQCF_01580 [Solirubrobacterales bacterium]
MHVQFIPPHGAILALVLGIVVAGALPVVAGARSTKAAQCHNPQFAAHHRSIRSHVR